MYILKIVLGILFFILSDIYFYFFFKKLLSTFKVSITNNIKVICLICALIVGSGCLNYLSYSAMMVYHFIIFNLITVLFFKLFSIFFNKKSEKMLNFIKKIAYLGIIPLIATISIFVYGYQNINTVYEKNYTISSNKIDENYKFLLLSDLHFGTIQNTNVLKESIEKFNSLNLDFVILDGDIVDEFTSKDNMQLVFKTLGEIETRFGIYYIYGNHDRQKKTSHKVFSEVELTNELTKNNINILSDSTVFINNDILLIGREDEQYNSKSRKQINNFLTTYNQNKFILVADHQPISIAENAKNNVDLQISGHTHAFQVWPLGQILNMFGFYTYGNYKIDNFNLIVTSGFAGWGFPLRTEKHCEYVVVDLISE